MHHRVATRSRGRALNARYEAVLAHYGVKSTRTNPRSSHENGVVEQGHRRLKNAIAQAPYPVFPILGVFRLNGQPKRDGSIIVRFCKASQSPVYPIRDAILAVNHASCPFLSSSCPCQCGETALKTRRLPEALSPSWQDRGCTLPQLGASDNRPIRSSTPWNNRRGTDTSDN